MKNVVRKFALLSALVIALAFAVSTNLGTASAGAAPCCSECDAMLYECIELEPGPQRDQCYNRYFSCLRWCWFEC